MTWTWSLPTLSPSRLLYSAPPFDLKRTRVVIPTYRDWEQARETVDGLLACSPRPAEIVLVDDNEANDPPRWARRSTITLLQYEGNHGPSFARNAGAWLRTGRLIEWLYFTDTGCGRDAEFFRILTESLLDVACVAAAGPVHGVIECSATSPINHYMTVEGILNPPMDAEGPQAIITANALVAAHAFDAVGGFDRSYPFAAAEDLDLGLRLRRMGRIAWVSGAIIRHRFEECHDDFQRRFYRYGRGSAHLEHRLCFPSIRPGPFAAELAGHQGLADLQVRSMCAGYDVHKAALSFVI